MKIASIHYLGNEEAAIICPDGAIPLSAVSARLGADWPSCLLEIIKSGRLEELNRWVNTDKGNTISNLQDRIIPFSEVRYAPLYREPSKIIGVGLNYPEHIVDLSERKPEIYPGTFIKPHTTIIGFGDQIMIPELSQRTTAEAELGIVIGREAKNIPRENWASYVAGFTCIIDMTAEDILVLNPRFLTLAKGFDSFFSFGPFLMTPEEVLPLGDQRISTVINGKVIGENIVSNMIYPPDQLISVYSSVYTLLPGDIISTGTPKAGVIEHGDVVEAKIEGFSTLKNTVVDMKRKSGKIPVL